jgi:hypothetical protein
MTRNSQKLSRLLLLKSIISFLYLVSFSGFMGDKVGLAII